MGKPERGLPRAAFTSLRGSCETVNWWSRDGVHRTGPAGSGSSREEAGERSASFRETADRRLSSG